MRWVGDTRPRDEASFFAHLELTLDHLERSWGCCDRPGALFGQASAFLGQLLPFFFGTEIESGTQCDKIQARLTLAVDGAKPWQNPHSNHRVAGSGEAAPPA